MNHQQQAVQSKLTLTVTAAALDELTSLKKVLEIQCQQNYKQQEYITLLEGENDDTKKLVENKQKEINALREEAYQNTQKIIQTEKHLAASITHQTALQMFADQNKMLLNRLQIEKEKLTNTELELKKTKDEKSDIQDLIESRLQGSVQIEVELRLDIKKITSELEITKEKYIQATNDIIRLKSLINDLEEKLKFSEERRLDEITRSRQIDYHTILRTENIENDLQKSIDETNILQTALSSAVSRGNELFNRLSTIADDRNEYEITYQKLYSKINSYENLLAEQKQHHQRDVTRLRQKLQNGNQTVSELLMKCHIHEQTNARLKDELATYRHINKAVHKKHTRKLSQTQTLPSLKSHQFIKPNTSSSFSFSSRDKLLHSSSSLAPAAVAATAPSSSSASADDFLIIPPTAEELAKRVRDSPKTLSSSSLHPSDLSWDDNHSTTSSMLDNTPSIEKYHSFPNPSTFTQKPSQLDNTPDSLASSSFFNDDEIDEELKNKFKYLEVQADHYYHAKDYKLGKKCLLSKYLRNIISVCNNFPNYQSTVQKRVLDLSRAALIDEDLPQVFGWLKLVSLQDFSLIDLRANLLTASGARAVVEWLLGRVGDEFTRDEPLLINFSQNTISMSVIDEIKTILQESEKPEIKSIRIETDTAEIHIYGEKQTKSIDTLTYAAVIKFLFRTPKNETIVKQYSKSTFSKPRSATAASPPSLRVSSSGNLNKMDSRSGDVKRPESMRMKKANSIGINATGINDSYDQKKTYTSKRTLSQPIRS